MPAGILRNARRSELNHPSGHSLDQLRLVAGEDDRQTLLPFRLEPLCQPRQTFGVKPLLWLVQDQQLARADERRSQSQPAALPRGQGAGQLAGLRNQLDLLQHFIDYVVRIGDPVRSGQQIQMLDHAQVGKEVKIIDHRGNVAPDLRRGLRHGITANLHAAIVWSVGAHQAAQQGGLAGAITSGECDRFSGTHLKAELVKNGVRPECPAQSGHLEDRRAFGHGGDSAPSRATNPKLTMQRIEGETGEGLARPKHDTRGVAPMMIAISTIASVLLPTF